jgi:ribonuclease VapC
MIVDSSAVLAVFFAEPEAAGIAELLATPGPKRISAVNWLECAIKLDNVAPAAALELDAFLEETGIVVVPATPAQARAARLAYRRFGKGRHPARLNLGDCFAYALARETGEPLLCKGNDFAATDLALVR